MSISDKQQLLFLINEAELIIKRLREAVEKMEPPRLVVVLPSQPEHPEMNAGEVAEYLRLRNATAMYCGDCNTGHLKKIRKGKRLFWLRAQVVRHRETEHERGSCDGSCVEAINTKQ